MLTAEQRYCFDVRGWVVLPAALDAAAVARARRGELDALDGATPTEIVSELCGGGPSGRSQGDCTLLRPPQLLDPRRVLSGGHAPDGLARSYVSDNGQRRCNTLQLLWCLDGQCATDLDSALAGEEDGSGCWVAYPASHLSNCPAPAALRDGAPSALRRQPALEPGDLLLCAASLLCGLLPPSPASGKHWRV
jgi:hypothetical protein